MLNKKILLLVLGVYSISFAQNSRFVISWDKNSEPNLDHYKIYKKTGTASFQLVNTIINHPDTVYIDNSVQKGILYSYRLKAVNTEANESPFSDIVSAAIPQITAFNDTLFMTNASSIAIDLNTKVIDPDDAENDLEWTISGNSLLTLEKTNNNLRINSPQNWTGSETLTFAVEDDQGFKDQKQVVISFASNSAPLFSTIPDQEILPNSELEINLSNYINDNDSRIDQLIFDYLDVDSVSLQISGHVLWLSPVSGFVGSRNITIIVTDNTGLSDQTSFNLRVVDSESKSKVIAYPMPYRKKDDISNQGISFAGVPANGKLLIYNLTGDPVFKTEFGNQQNFSWDVKNNSGKAISSGLYIYVIKNENNKKVASGKIVIVR